MKHKEGWWRQCQEFVGELCKEGWWNLCKILAAFCLIILFLCGGLTFIFWLIGGLLTRQWEVPPDGLFFWLFCYFLWCFYRLPRGWSCVDIKVDIKVVVENLGWGYISKAFISFFVSFCLFQALLLGVKMHFTTIEVSRPGIGRYSGTEHPRKKKAKRRQKEARYMHMTNAEKWEEFVIGIKGGVFGAFAPLVLLAIIAGLAGKLDDEETDD